MNPLHYPIFHITAFARVLSNTFSLQWDIESNCGLKFVSAPSDVVPCNCETPAFDVTELTVAVDNLDLLVL